MSLKNKGAKKEPNNVSLWPRKCHRRTIFDRPFSKWLLEELIFSLVPYKKLLKWFLVQGVWLYEELLSSMEPFQCIKAPKKVL